MGWIKSNFTIRRSDRPEDPDGTGLRFTDVLFGFVFKEIFFRLSDWQNIPGPNAWVVRSHLILAAVVTLGSYIGFRNSLKRQNYRINFINLPFVKFGLDQTMVVLYFVLATRTPDKIEGFDATSGSYDESWAVTSVAVVCWILVLYLAWDIASWIMTKRNYTAIKFDPAGLAITAAALILVAMLWLVARQLEGDLGAATILLVTAGFLVLYRFAKDHRRQTPAT